MNTIIILIDFSPASDEAIGYALALSKHYAVESLVLYHHQYTPVAGVNGGQANVWAAMPNYIDQETAKLEPLKNCVQQKAGPDLKIKCHINNLPMHEAIKNLIDVFKPDLFLAGQPLTGNWSSLNEQLYKAVLAASQVPILIVPRVFTMPVKNILLACNLKNVHQTVPASKIRRWLKYFNAKLHVIYNNKNASEYNATIVAEQFTLLKCFEAEQPHFASPASQNTAQAIVEYVNAHAIEMVALISKERSLWNEIFNKNIIRQLIKQLPVPVLLLKAKA